MSISLLGTTAHVNSTRHQLPTTHAADGHYIKESPTRYTRDTRLLLCNELFCSARRASDDRLNVPLVYSNLRQPIKSSLYFAHPRSVSGPLVRCTLLLKISTQTRAWVMLVAFQALYFDVQFFWYCTFGYAQHTLTPRSSNFRRTSTSYTRQTRNKVGTLPVTNVAHPVRIQGHF